MNFKTTFLLAITMGVLAVGYLWFQANAEPLQPITTPPPFGATDNIAADLIAEPLGDLDKVVCTLASGDEWVFERTTDEAKGDGWRMTAPTEMTAITYEVDRIGNTLGRVQYEVRCTPGDGDCVTPAEAGLTPPKTIVAMTDESGRTVAVEIGKPASGQETYVRLAGEDTIYLAKNSFRNLIKPKALDYKDKLLWSFDMKDVTRIEIEDRSDGKDVRAFILGKTAGQWMFEQPVTAKATSKIDDMLRSLQRMRTMKWYDDRPERLAGYGLDPGELVIKATVVEDVEPAPADEADADEAPGDDDKPKTPEKKTTVYVLRVSNQSPIGEETKTYIRIGDEPFVGTVTKNVTDRLKPVMAQWRDMRITDAGAGRATRIELSTPSGNATLVKEGGRWTFENDGGDAEAKDITALLSAIDGLSAVAFVNVAAPKLADYGLDKPRATIRLTIPGVENEERIVVGGFTDSKTKRLVYLRRNEVASIAKVRASDVDKLIRSGSAYRDRTVFDLPKLEIQAIRLDRHNPLTNERTAISLERRDGAWRMTAPIDADVRQDVVQKMAELLSGLRADSIVAEGGQLTAYGLNAPLINVEFTRQPPPEYRVEVKEGDDGAEAEPVAIEQPAETLRLAVTEHDGKTFASRTGHDAVYAVGKDLIEKLMAEVLPDEVWTFDADKVVRFSVQSGSSTDTFVREGDDWLYDAERDLPLDAKKVEDLLLRLADLKAERFVDYHVEDPARYGLTAPTDELTVILEDGSTHMLSVSGTECCPGAPRTGRYATVKGSGRVFVMPRDSTSRYQVDLDGLERGH